MKRFYSKNTGVTYLSGIHKVMPDDAVELSEEVFLSVIGNPAPGKVRSHDANGFPILIDPPPPPPLTMEQVEEFRIRAYADPTTGSDRYFAEVSRLQAMGGSTEEIEVARAAGIARYAEIQGLYPWP